TREVHYPSISVSRVNSGVLEFTRTLSSTSFIICFVPRCTGEFTMAPSFGVLDQRQCTATAPTYAISTYHPTPSARTNLTDARETLVFPVPAGGSTPREHRAGAGDPTRHKEARMRNVLIGIHLTRTDRTGVHTHAIEQSRIRYASRRRATWIHAA